MASLSQCSPALLKALGTMSDFKVAAKFRRRPFEIKHLRLEHKIPSVSEHLIKHSFTWTPATEALLGTMPDTVLATRLNTTKSIVNTHRNQLNIPAFELPTPVTGNYHIEQHKWTSQEDQLLGSDFDTVIAEQLGLHTLQVTYQRNKLGIEPFYSSGPISWTDAMLRNLGEISDVDFAEYFEISKASVYMKRILLKIPAFGFIDPPNVPSIPKEAYPLLGKVTDSELSKRFALNRINFRINRALLGLPPAKASKPSNQYQWTLTVEALLGTMSDGELACQLQVSKNVVQYRRRQLNIEAYSKQQAVNWDEKMLAQLGRINDLAIAQILHCHVALIKDKRESLEIAEHQGPRSWTEAELKLIGSISDPELAKRIGVSATAVANKRKKLGIKALTSGKALKWSQHNLQLLGTMPDASLAYKMNVHNSSVSKKRIALEIPVFVSEHKGLWLDPANRALLGTMPDPQLAKRLGITAPAICLKRKQMGVPAFK